MLPGAQVVQLYVGKKGESKVRTSFEGVKGFQKGILETG